MWLKKDISDNRAIFYCPCCKVDREVMAIAEYRVIGDPIED